MRRRDRQDRAVLTVLAHGPASVFEILTHGATAWPWGIYSTLDRLEAASRIVSELVEVDGTTRRVYRLTGHEGAGRRRDCSSLRAAALSLNDSGLAEPPDYHAGFTAGVEAVLQTLGADPPWLCEECHAIWAPLLSCPGRCAHCGNRTRVPAVQ